jgi:hypothetical protein
MSHRPENLSTDKHSSLFCRGVSGEEKQFCNIDTWFPKVSLSFLSMSRMVMYFFLIVSPEYNGTLCIEELQGKTCLV